MRLPHGRDATGNPPLIEIQLAAPQQGPCILRVGLERRFDPRFEGGRLMEHIERVASLRNHLAAIRHQVAGHCVAAGRRPADDATVGQIDLQHLRGVERQEEPVRREDAAAAGAALISGQGTLPERAAVR